MSNRHEFIREVAEVVSLYFPDVSKEKIEKITKCLIFKENQFPLKKVESYYDLCLRCGWCCNKACIDFDKKNYTCGNYKNRPKECSQWPYWRIHNEQGIYCELECNYSFRMVVQEVIKAIEGLDEVPDVPEAEETFII